MSKFLQIPLFIILIPVFFVFHGYYENYEFLKFSDVVSLTAFYCGSAIALFLLIYILNRNIKKAALLTALLLMMFFFFGFVYDFFRGNTVLAPLGRYVILFPSFVILIFLIFRHTVRSEIRLVNFVNYLNLLFLLFIILDGFAILFIKSAKHPYQNAKVSTPGLLHASCNTCRKPDIFFLIFDEYESPTSLKERFNFQSDIDTFLVRNGFRVQKHSRSNYHFTPFSIASILNMSYISGITDKNAVTIDDYASCNALIADSEVARFLQRMGYQVLNYSIFDLEGNPSLVNESFLPVKTNLITGRTLISKMRRDLEWMLVIRFSFLVNKYYEAFFRNNNRFLQLVREASVGPSSQPRFVYAHFNIPHQPYFVDRNGKRRDNAEVYTAKDISSPASYLEYVQYANTEIKSLVTKIQHDNPTAVVVLMGDHGFRIRKGPSVFQPFLFRNLNAVYIPDSNYPSFNDSITGVNQFRAIFNDVFQQKIPLLRDSVVFLKDKRSK